MSKEVIEVSIALVAELIKSFITNIIPNMWNSTETFSIVHENLQTTLNAVQETLERIQHSKSRLAYSQIPFDWLDELVWCQHEIEDTTHNINLAVSKEPLTTKMMRSNLKRIQNLRMKLEGVETKLSIGNIDPADRLGFGRRGESHQLLPLIEPLRVEEKEAIIADFNSQVSIPRSMYTIVSSLNKT